MTNMKVERTKSDCCSPCMPEDSPEYPYGLRICLNTESLKKLGIIDLPDLGKAMTIQAKVVVCATSENQNIYGTDKTMDLQITDMEIKDE